jgi:cytochrome c-type biogenesis protein CcmF
MLVGILISSAKKETLSINTTGITINFGPEAKQDPMENITLLQGVRTDMGKYWTTFVSSDSVDSRSKTTYYRIHFEKKDGARQFDLYPDVMKATKGMEGFSANPDKYHYWDRDIFTYISYAEKPDNKDTSGFRNSDPLSVKDTAYFSKGFVILDSVIVNPNNGKYHFSSSDTALMAKVTIVGKDSLRSTAYPVFYFKNNAVQFLNDTVFAQDLAIRFNRIVEGKKVELGLKESSTMVPFVALKVLEFPQINILWIGTIIMIIGFIMSILWRRRQATLNKV